MISQLEQPTILVVDDDADNVRILEIFLNSHGYKTDRAYTGEETLRKVFETNNDYDLILLDVMLPDTSGYQVCEKIKSTPSIKEIPITFVTALDKMDDKLKSLNLGAEDFLSKPIDEKELIIKVKRQISNRQILEKNKREKRELKSLSSILSINYYEKDLEEILDTITIETSLLLDSDRTSIFLKSGNYLISKNAQGIHNKKPLVIPVDQGICGYVARNAEAYISNDVQNDAVFNMGIDKKTGYITKRVIAYPIFHKEKVIGVIQSLNKKKPYNEYDLEMLKKLADHTANILIRFYAEKKVKESEKLHRNLMERLSNAILTVDENDKITYVNTAFNKLTGYQSGEILRKDLRILFIPSDLTNLLEIGEKAQNVETQIINKDFELLPVEVTMTKYEPDSKKSYRIFSFNDLRERYEVEKHQLELDKMRSDFNSMIIHDLKNPLSIIIGFAELMQSNALGDLNEKQGDYVNKIISSSEQMLKLTNEMLEISKYEAGKMHLKYSQVNVSEVIEEIATSQTLMFKKKNIEFNEHKIDIPLISGDQDKLKRVFNNLIGNAIKFTPENGNIDVYYKLQSDNNKTYLLVEVRDNGVGIPEDDLKNLFNKYKQSARNKAFTSDEGTGLGLAICKMISESHNGSIYAQSIENKGSSFFVKLPVSQT